MTRARNMAPAKSVFREYFEALLIAVIFATFARTYAVQAFKIPTGSMEENLLVGDHILVNKFVFGPASSPLESIFLPLQRVRRGDVTVFKYPEDPSRDFIKRCIGLPGDVIEIVDKRIFVNDVEVDDDSYTLHSDSRVYPNSVFLHESYRLRDNFGPFTVPDDHLFFLGDNRDNSNDSRFWGPVPSRYVKGRAFMVYWSFAGPRDASIPSDQRGKMQQLSNMVLGFFKNTRWERSFQVVK